MDRIDKQILDILQNNAQITNQELAEKVSLSPTPCLRRVKILEEKGYINKHVALLNPDALGLSFTALVQVSLINHSSEIMAAFSKAVQSYPEVTHCYLITGHSSDYFIKVVVPDLASYQAFLLEKLTKIEGVNTIQSSFVLQTITETTALPLDAL